MDLINILPEIQGTYKKNASLKQSNWFNVGGNAEILYKPLNLEDLVFFMKNKPKEIDYFILGVGSNTLIRDGGIEGVVIKLGRAFNNIEIVNESQLRVGASVLNINLVNFCLENSIENFEFMVGIPGTIGGGIAMNAGAYGAEFKDLIDYIIAIDEEGRILKLSNSEIGFHYRGNSLSQKMIFVEAVFNYTLGKQNVIKEKIDKIIETRGNTQPVKTKTGGSTFANPPNNKAWELIDKAGCRGLQIGDAQVSLLHCNFLINLGNATAKDLEDLGEKVRKKVFELSGVNLKWEIQRRGKYE